MRHIRFTSISLVAALAIVSTPSLGQQTQLQGPPPVGTPRAIGANFAPGTFRLWSSEQAQIIRYPRDRLLTTCLDLGSDVRKPETARIPLDIVWSSRLNSGQMKASIMPGNCLFFSGNEVTVSAGAPLPAGVAILGTFDDRGSAE